MRKNKILITFLFFTTFLCSAQKESTSKKKVLGLRVGVGLLSVNDSFNYNLNMSIEKGKSYFAIGPVFGEPIETDYNSHNDISDKELWLNGISFVYQRNPNPKGKRFDFYFQYTFGYFYNSDKGKFWYYPPIYGSINQKFNNYDFQKSIFASTIGYGFKCKIFQNLYLFQDFGMGAGYTSLTINYDDTKSDINRKYFDPTIGLNLGLEYKFDKKIRK
ncbi:hypothetical protein [Lacihabitans soyangensis]|uniref:DUF3575 domain-containing protein n=1 Tax=Lacihabitans soyangensis TaxID=869394 RepID=A0AAE3KV37_9BACT|nr:hypothetical protein [Lacihabitans soyangensis]MCP9765609.1 hypothetical protein [Lacihabitans soyangensis]